MYTVVEQGMPTSLGRPRRQLYRNAACIQRRRTNLVGRAAKICFSPFLTALPPLSSEKQRHRPERRAHPTEISARHAAPLILRCVSRPPPGRIVLAPGCVPVGQQRQALFAPISGRRSGICGTVSNGGAAAGKLFLPRPPRFPRRTSRRGVGYKRRDQCAFNRPRALLLVVLRFSVWALRRFPVPVSAGTVPAPTPPRPHPLPPVLSELVCGSYGLTPMQGRVPKSRSPCSHRCLLNPRLILAIGLTRGFWANR